jgi:DNA polymerase-3 subunit gamma/tau
MAYLVLARKYRPATLAELVGQEHIARALCNAIEMKRVPHALLFCGARGTGKTSTARIVAKMLNCENGPTPTPCGVCAPCKEIASSTCIDVHELDAASNRGIDEIRELRSGVGYSPVRDRHKIYIIDEAHMLTNEAANAFLKTLEEPPAHVTFILATTDPQRLPITIRSRCQRYDFRRVKAADIVKLLAKICASENVVAEQEALYLVAREGDGSLRDSLSVLDQVIAFGGANLLGDEVAGLLGVADRNRTHALMQALLQRDAQSAIESVAAAHDHGMDLKTFARTMAMESRDLLVARLTGANARDLVDRAETELEQLQAMAKDVGTPELERLAHVLLELAEQVARASHPRLALELGMIRLCRAAALLDVADLAVRVEALLGGGRGLPPSRGPQQSPQGAPPRPSTPGLPPPSGLASPTNTPRPLPSPGLPSPSAPPTWPTAPMPSPLPTPGARAMANPLPAPGAPPAPRVTPAATAGATGPLDDAKLLAWAAAIRDAGMATVATLIERALATSDGRVVTLRFATEFLSASARELDALDALRAGAARVFGDRRVEIGPPDPRANQESLSGRRQREKATTRSEREAVLTQDERVQMVKDAFGGEITQVSIEEAGL